MANQFLLWELGKENFMNVLKKYLTGTLAVAVSFSFMTEGVSAATVTAEIAEHIISNEISDKIPDAATNLVEQQLESIIDVSKDLSEELRIDANDLEKVSIGTPYIVYDVADTVQDEIYHYPIINENDGSVVLMVDVMGTTDGWHYDISTEHVSDLNDIDYAKQDYIFYGTDGNIVAENADTREQFAGCDSKREIKEFESSGFCDKVEAISERVDSLQKTDTDIQIEEGINATYTPQVVDVEVGIGKKCELYNRQTQGGLGLCWAASIATIANYLNGTNYTPIQIADAEGIEYDAGADNTKALKAMHDFGVPYNTIGTTLSWSDIVSKISLKTPIYIVSRRVGGAHATVIYGYKYKDGTQYLAMWNPGTAQVGATEVIAFNSDSTTFSYAGSTYTWRESIYR